MRHLKQLLIGSLIVNVMFVGLSGLFLHRRGGIAYLIDRATAQPVGPPPAYVESPLYRGRTDLYTKLPLEDAPIVFAGDSITHFCPWHELLRRPVLNRGIEGDTVAGLRGRIGEVLQHHPRHLFVMIGINDLMDGKTGDEVIAEYQPLINQITTASPHTQVLLQSILPVDSDAWSANWGKPLRTGIGTHILQINKALAAMADGKHIVYVDLYSAMVAEGDRIDRRYTSDGVHLTGDGYAKWRDVIQPYLPVAGADAS